METLFYVLDRNYNRIGLIDTFVSLMWCKRYYEIGALDLQIEATVKNFNLLEMGNYIVREDDDCVFRIESREIETNDAGESFIIIGGVDCKAILSQRIIWKTISWRGMLRDYISQMIYENVINPELTQRRIPNFAVVDNELVNDVIIQQASYDVLSEKITELCRGYLLGWKVYLEDGVFKFTLYSGEDRSNRVEFSIDNDNLISTKTINDATQYKNTALVAGEGEGEDRTKVWIGNATGLARYETFIDESSSSDGLENIEYLNQLKSKGFEILAESHYIQTFEGEIDATNSRYKVDYNLGDVVRVKNELGMESTARITEIIETWDDDGYTIEPKLEYLEFQSPAPTNVNDIGDVVATRRLATVSAYPEVLATEIDQQVLVTNTVRYEEPISNTVKISALPQAGRISMNDYFPIVQDGETKTTTLQTIRDASGLTIPTGTVFLFFGATAPAGYLFLDGAEYGVAEYPVLAKLMLPLPFNDGVEAGRFRVPDMRARFPQGADGNLGQTIEAGLPNFSGELGVNGTGGYMGSVDVYTKGHVKVRNASAWWSKENGGANRSGRYSGVIDLSNASPVYGKSDTVQPPAVALNYIIKT